MNKTTMFLLFFVLQTVSTNAQECAKDSCYSMTTIGKILVYQQENYSIIPSTIFRRKFVISSENKGDFCIVKRRVVTSLKGQDLKPDAIEVDHIYDGRIEIYPMLTEYGNDIILTIKELTPLVLPFDLDTTQVQNFRLDSHIRSRKSSLGGTNESFTPVSSLSLTSEIIETPIGDFECVKISGVYKHSLRKKKLLFERWFNSSMGLIKENMTSIGKQKNKLLSSMILMEIDSEESE